MIVAKKDLKVFIFIWAFIFFTIGIYPFFYNKELQLWAIVLSVCFVIVAFLRPIIFLVFYQIWTKFGIFIGGIISKIIMFVLYFGLFTPVSILLKILGKDLLNKKVNKSQVSYWIDRETQPQSMRKQF